MRATMLCRGKNNWKNKRQLTFQWTHPKGEDIFRQTTEMIYTDNYVEEHLCRRMVKGVHSIVLRAPARLTSKIIEAVDILGVISGVGVGVDNIDVQVATERGILALHDAQKALKKTWHSMVTETAPHNYPLPAATIRNAHIPSC